ncbi:hypothetical protein GLYMA_02G011700v4 [Glycine max]|uniref:Uncharacterized protein n=1 Tax=Glycine max TaxID=3847 RepID=K7K5W2_SOYBN|nr:hypothetical protein GYH30_002669 [Glycine max]KRH69209.1 hypothetical protein GLYMA_02G011700v4 [Glycine max]
MHLSLSHTDPTPPQVREAANLAKEVCRSTIQSCRFVVPSHLHGHRHWSSALTFGTSRQSTSSSIQIHSAKKLSQKCYSHFLWIQFRYRYQMQRG